MAYQGLTDGPLSGQVAERYRKDAEARASLIDGIARNKELEYAKIPGRGVRGPDPGIRMAGEAISRVADRVSQASRAAANAPVSTPSWTDTLTTDYSRSPGFFVDKEAASAAFDDSTAFRGGVQTEPIGEAFGNVFRAGTSGIERIIGDTTDWSSTAFGF